MTAPEAVPAGVHFWWCRSVLRPHDGRCSCPPAQLLAAYQRELQAKLAEVGEAK